MKMRAYMEETDFLEEIDFPGLRAAIRTTGCTGAAFKALIAPYVDLPTDDDEQRGEIGYDDLDLFLNALSSYQTMPEQTKELEPEMVFYQKTPARIVFELVEKVHFKEEDVFFDLGSGLGQVAILVNLLAGIPAKGVEFEPAFCDHARDCATELNLSRVEFMNVDARMADYSDGTIFFMFTPFRGQIMQEVLETLRKESLLRNIKIIAYGPCTDLVALQSWLVRETPEEANSYTLGIFSSIKHS